MEFDEKSEGSNGREVSGFAFSLTNLFFFPEKSKQDCMMKAVNGVAIIVQCLQVSSGI